MDKEGELGSLSSSTVLRTWGVQVYNYLVGFRDNIVHQ